MPQSFRFQTKVSTHQPENTLDFVWGTTPVIGGKCIQRQARDAGIRCALDKTPHCGNSGTVTNSRQPATCFPAAVAIHNDCHVQSVISFTLHRKVTSQKKIRLAPASAGVRGWSWARLWSPSSHREPPAQAWKD